MLYACHVIYHINGSTEYNWLYTWLDVCMGLLSLIFVNYKSNKEKMPSGTINFSLEWSHKFFFSPNLKWLNCYLQVSDHILYFIGKEGREGWARRVHSVFVSCSSHKGAEWGGKDVLQITITCYYAIAVFWLDFLMSFTSSPRRGPCHGFKDSTPACREGK